MNIKSVSLSVLTIIFCFSASSCNRSGKIIGINENIHHDDFEYAVTGFSVAGELVSNQDTLKAQGKFYLVTFRVINKALRVNHDWTNSIAYVKDNEGHTYENNEAAQKILDSGLKFGFKERYVTPSQATDTTILVFDLPENINQPYLMVRGEVLMGDLFDRAKFRRTKVRLF